MKLSISIPTLALLALTALPSGALPVASTPPVAQQALTRDSLQSDIDQALRWVRGQLGEDGSYGELRVNSLVLLAFAESPRAYRPGDGPFLRRPFDALLAHQRADGSFGDRAATQVAYLVLQKMAGPDEFVLRDRAADYLGALNLADPMAHRDVASLEAEARMHLGLRNGNGAWGKDGGDLRSTATKIIALSRIHRRLGELAPKKSDAAPEPAEALPSLAEADRERVQKALVRGADFLVSQDDEGRGAWGFQGQADPGITAMVVGALLHLPEPRPENVQARIASSLDWLVSLQKEDGSIHAGQLANYVTSASVMALARAGRAQDRPVIERARDYLRVLQADEGEGYSEDHHYYGGVGYGGDERPDLSNLQMALEALHDAGLQSGDETFQKALVFLQRCQNDSETNDLVLEVDGVKIQPGNDGGAGYAPGESKAGFVQLADGKKVVRSYGSMTYALLKGYLFAGLERDDPRVQGAWKWLSEHYTLDVNPGFEASKNPRDAYQGLFYYFTTMAKALDLYGVDQLTDSAGRTHAWRSELAGRLTAMQRQDGSWINTNSPRWFEGNPVLATAYALISLGTALPR